MTQEEAKNFCQYAEGKPIQVKIEGTTQWYDTDKINLEYEGQIINIMYDRK